MGGTCIGEHGIGQGKKHCMRLQHGAPPLEPMRTLKHAVDPIRVTPGKRILKSSLNAWGMAQSGRFGGAAQCPLCGQKRTWIGFQPYSLERGSAYKAVNTRKELLARKDGPAHGADRGERRAICSSSKPPICRSHPKRSKPRRTA